MKIHARSMSVERDIRYELIARLCPNATGAELRSVCTEAGMFAIRSRRKVKKQRCSWNHRWPLKKTFWTLSTKSSKAMQSFHRLPNISWPCKLFTALDFKKTISIKKRQGNKSFCLILFFSLFHHTFIRSIGWFKHSWDS